MTNSSTVSRSIRYQPDRPGLRTYVSFGATRSPLTPKCLKELKFITTLGLFDQTAVYLYCEQPL